MSRDVGQGFEAQFLRQGNRSPPFGPAGPVGCQPPLEAGFDERCGGERGEAPVTVFFGGADIDLGLPPAHADRRTGADDLVPAHQADPQPLCFWINHRLEGRVFFSQGGVDGAQHEPIGNFCHPAPEIQILILIKVEHQPGNADHALAAEEPVQLFAPGIGKGKEHQFLFWRGG